MPISLVVSTLGFFYSGGSAQAREVILFKGGKTYAVGRLIPISAKQGDFVKLDLNQGTITIKTTFTNFDFPQLAESNGGNQTILRIRRGGVFAKVRRFTNKFSYFGIVDYADPPRSVVARGTGFYVLVEDGRIVSAVESSQVRIDNGKGATAMIGAGEGAIASDAGITLFKLDYALEVTKSSVTSTDGRTNLFKGCLAQGNYIEILGETFAPDEKGCFAVKSDKNFYYVVNPLGTGRYYSPPGTARPFFGS